MLKVFGRRATIDLDTTYCALLEHRSIGQGGGGLAAYERAIRNPVIGAGVGVW
jgi:hypothetical protein